MSHKQCAREHFIPCIHLSATLVSLPEPVNTHDHTDAHLGFNQHQAHAKFETYIFDFQWILFGSQPEAPRRWRCVGQLAQGTIKMAWNDAELWKAFTNVCYWEFFLPIPRESGDSKHSHTDPRGRVGFILSLVSSVNCCFTRQKDI